jgi:hypothetical protein
MFYTIQHTLANLLKSPDPQKDFAPTVTGPRALHQGFQTFCGSNYNIPDSAGPRLGVNHPIVKGGLFRGADNRTVMVDGDIELANDIIMREAIGIHAKRRYYRQMNMTHFSQDFRKAPKGESCLAMLRESFLQETPRAIHDAS